MFCGIFKAIRRIERLMKIRRIHDDLLHARGGVGICRVLNEVWIIWKGLNSMPFLEREDGIMYSCMIMHRDLQETCETSGSAFNMEMGARE
jgi:hypothetical protein